MATAARSRYGPTTARPKNDAYTGLLFISFLALVASCIFLYLDYDQYGKSSPQFKPDIKTGGSTGSLPGPSEPSPSGPTGGEPMGAGDMAPMGGAAPMNPMGGAGPMNPMPNIPVPPMNPGGVPMPGKPPGATFDNRGGANSTTAVDSLELPPLSPPPRSSSGR